VSDDWSEHAWLLAVIAADRSGDLGPLIARLRSAPPSQRASELIADLLARHQLKKPPGGRARAVYEPLTDDEVNLLVAAKQYHEQGQRFLSKPRTIAIRTGGWRTGRRESFDDATARVATEHGVNVHQLRNLLRRHGGLFSRLDQLGLKLNKLIASI
jgi:hypothetical protein